jgi:hypothetical protein
VIVAVMGAGWIVEQDDRANDNDNHCRSAPPPYQRRAADAGRKPGQDGEKQRRAVVIEVIANLARES